MINYCWKTNPNSSSKNNQGMLRYGLTFLDAPAHYDCIGFEPELDIRMQGGESAYLVT